MSEIDLKKYNLRTDLVVDLFSNFNIKDGDYKKYNKKNVDVTDITLDNDNVLKRKKGRYISISFNDITDNKNYNNVKEIFSDCLYDLLKEKNLLNKKSLVVGLGNIKSTPDSLGPKSIEKIIVTSYLFNNPEISVDKKYSNVSAIAPGVVANTGIETSDLILGIVEKSKPDYLIVIDALASSSIDRINKTIQITDSGIAPGSGIGNKRKEISYETLNIPVIAIGVPTVIDGVTIVNDTIHYMFKKFSYNKDNINNNINKLIPITNINYSDHNDNLTNDEKKELFGIIGDLSDEDIKNLIFEVLTPINYNLMVTVKEIDFLIDKLSSLLADGINKCLHNK